MIVVACGSCGAHRPVNDVRALTQMTMCKRCGSGHLDLADEFDFAQLVEAGKTAIRFGVPEGLPCPQCGHLTHFVGRVKGERRWYCPSCRWKGAITEEEPAAKAAKTASDDLGPGAGGLGSMWHQLMTYLRGGSHDEIPPWFPKKWQTEDELRTHHWTHAGEMSMDFASSQHTAAGVPVPVTLHPDGDVWAYLQEQLGTVSVDHLVPKGDGSWEGVLIVPENLVDAAKALSNGQKAAASWRAAGWSYPSGGPLEDFYKSQLGLEVGEEYPGYPGSTVIDIIRDTDESIVVKVRGPDGEVRDQPRMIWGPPGWQSLSVIHKAAWGIFTNDDRKMVYGPTTKEAIEMAMASGRYPADRYYTGTLPDHPNTEGQPPPPYSNVNPFADVQVRTPIYLSKVREIASGIRATNPGLNQFEAADIALNAVRRFPAMVRQADWNPRCHYCNEEITYVSGPGWETLEDDNPFAAQDCDDSPDGRHHPMPKTAAEPKSNAQYMSELGREDAKAGRPRDPQGDQSYDTAYDIWSKKDDKKEAS